MSCGEQKTCENKVSVSPSLLEKQPNFERAKKIVKEMQPDDITKDVTYIDHNCHGCLVGHILKITEGLNYADYKENQASYPLKSIITKGCENQFGDKGVWVDGVLSDIHKDYAGHEIDFGQMKLLALEALEAFSKGEDYDYDCIVEGDDYDDYDDDYYGEDEE